jgi:hypothetical protein
MRTSSPCPCSTYRDPFWVVLCSGVMVDCVRGPACRSRLYWVCRSRSGVVCRVSEYEEGCRIWLCRDKMSSSLYLWEADGQVYWQDLGSGVSRYWHERVRAFTQASPTNLTSEGAAYSLPFASPSRYGGVVSSIEQVFRVGPLLWGGTSRRLASQ